MSVLLEAYRRIATSDRVRKQGNGHNGPCPFCGGSSGTSARDRSDRFVVWEDKRDNLGETCAQHGIAGVWYCRQCEKSGDTIAFLMEADGMTFKSACAELGITTTARRAPSRRTPQPPRKASESFAPSEWPIKAADEGKWREYAAKLHAEARENLHASKSAIDWLARRGLDQAAIDRYQLGYLPGENGKPGRYRDRSALGLAPVPKPDGGEKTIIFIPRGITIPHFDAQGRVIRLRIRRPKPDVEQWGQKYLVLEGSSSQPMLLEADRPRQLSAYVVVEAELDAMLVHHATNQAVGALAALTNRGKPDATQHPIMQDAAAILVALDYDPRQVTKPDGSVVTETPGGQGWTWWSETYKNARRWPVTVGKDPGDAYAEGLDIRSWIAAGLPPSISLDAQTEPHRGSIPNTSTTSQNISQNGTTEPFSTGMSTGGGGGTAKATPQKHPASGQNALNLPDYLPYEHIPPAILELHTAWRRVPGFTVIKRDDGGGYRWNNTWARSSDENWKAIGELQRAISDNSEWWEWVHVVNQNKEVTLENLFRIYD